MAGALLPLEKAEYRGRPVNEAMCIKALLVIEVQKSHNVELGPVQDTALCLPPS